MEFESALHRKVKAALSDFFSNDRDLLERDVNERSISHKFAEYLQHQFEGLKVDCEYNRHQEEVKSLKYPRPEKTSSDSLDAKTVYPDIVVHRRGCDSYNLLVIEVKKQVADGISQNEKKAKKKDKEKLRAFTAHNNGYNYRLGLLLVFDVSKKRVSSAVCFRNGERWECDLIESLKGFDGQ